MALPPIALTTVAAVNEAAPTGATTARLEQLIAAVSEHFARLVGVDGFGLRAFPVEAPDVYQGTGRHHLILRRFPVVAVQEVRLDGAAITDYSLTSDLAEQGILYRASTWPALAPSRAPLVGDPDLTPGSLAYNVSVAWKGGYILPQFGGVVDATHNPTGAARSLPYDLEEACISEVLLRVVRPVPGLRQERTPGGHATTWSEDVDFVSRETRAVLNQYRRLWVG